MILRIRAVGRIRGDLQAPIERFQKRCARYWKLRVDEVREGKGDPDAVRSQETERLLEGVAPGNRLHPLTRTGKPWDSEQWAARLEKARLHSTPEVVFLIGGAFGLDLDLLPGDARPLSLSALTLPHDLARLVLFEQLYRAGTILRGEPYHKGASSQR